MTFPANRSITEPLGEGRSPFPSGEGRIGIALAAWRAELEFDRPRPFHWPERIPGNTPRMTSKGTEKMSEITIGVDISKDTLDAHRLPDGASRSFANTPAGHKALIAWAGHGVTRIVFEPTGPYHAAFERVLAKAGLPIVKVNPRQARRFAEATGKLAKTDRRAFRRSGHRFAARKARCHLRQARAGAKPVSTFARALVDAAVLARMGLALDLQAQSAPDPSLSELKELHLARAALIKDRTAARNRAKTLTLAVLKRHNDQRLRQIERQLAAIEAEIETRIKADPELAHRFAILLSIPGIARVSAFTLLIEMPELGTMEAKQAASLAGLAPVARQSGRWTGRAFIRGGRASLRQALYMPALVAMRFNPDLQAKYRQLVDAGKPAKVAITAIMRKLVVLANALLRHGRKWSENPA